jgi:hypothetical protein
VAKEEGQAFSERGRINFPFLCLFHLRRGPRRAFGAFGNGRAQTVERMALLTLPIRGHVVELDVPAELRTTIARDIVIQAGFARRTGHKIASPRGLARSIARKWIAANADPAAFAGRLDTLRANIETADDMATDSEEVPLPDLCRRLFLGETEDGSEITGERWDRLTRASWAVAGHRPRLDCETCAPLFSGQAGQFLALTGTPEIVCRILHTELEAAGALPPYSPKPIGQPLRRRRSAIIPDI